MARPRLELQSLLEGIMSNHTEDGNQHVWFQPPSSVYLSYPGIVYHRSGKDILRADNKKYRTMDKYSVTVMDLNPDSPIPSDIEELEYCSFDRSFSVDGLYHTTYTLYY